MQSPERPPLLKTASRRSLLRRAHLRRALFAALLLYLGLWAPAALRLQAAALPSLLQTLETAIFDAPCADCYSISLDSPCSTEISESKWCQRFWWARRALPASPLLGRPAAADALILDLNCRHQYRYDYYHMLFDCSIPIMPMLGLVRRQEALGAPSALVGVHERGFQNVTAAVLQSFSPYPFVHVDGRVAEEAVVYGGDAALRAADMAPAYWAYVHRRPEDPQRARARDPHPQARPVAAPHPGRLRGRARPRHEHRRPRDGLDLRRVLQVSGLLAGHRQAGHRACAYAPYAGVLWCETDKPCLEEARAFAAGVHARFPLKLPATSSDTGAAAGTHFLLPRWRSAARASALTDLGASRSGRLFCFLVILCPRIFVSRNLRRALLLQ